MKRILLTALLCAPLLSLAIESTIELRVAEHLATEPLIVESRIDESHVDQEPLDLEVRKVYDGDTIMVTLNSLPSPLSKVSIRLFGIDTPERGHRAACEQEADLAEKAADYLKRRIKAGSVIRVTEYKWDKYGGRILGIVHVGNIVVNQIMIERGYAMPYFGEGKKNDWCK